MTVRQTSVLGSGVTASTAAAMAWTANTFYPLYMDVINSGLTYRCNTAHTSGATFSPANWTLLTSQLGQQSNAGMQGALRGDSGIIPTIRSVVTLDSSTNEFSFNGRVRGPDPAVHSTIIRNQGVNNLDVLLGTFTDSWGNPGGGVTVTLTPGQEVMFGANQYAKSLRPSVNGQMTRAEIDVELRVAA